MDSASARADIDGSPCMYNTLNSAVYFYQINHIFRGHCLSSPASALTDGLGDDTAEEDVDDKDIFVECTKSPATSGASFSTDWFGSTTTFLQTLERSF
jgi:hypothetical protein